MKLWAKIKKSLKSYKPRTKSRWVFFTLINFGITLISYIYIGVRLKYLNTVIPLWPSRLWGDSMLADKEHIYIIPLISLLISLAGICIILLNRYYIQYFQEVFLLVVFLSNSMLFYSIYRIVSVNSMPFSPLVDPIYLSLLPPFLLSFLVVYFLLPYFIEYAISKKMVTNPQIHNHPAMILRLPSARGGGFFYGVVFMLLSMLFVGFSYKYIGLYLSVFMISLLGIFDDYQNTHPSSTTRVLENPILRLFLLFMSILPAITSGTLITYIGNPFLGGTFHFDAFTINFLGSSLPWISFIVTSFWIVWVLNVLSWSNGIDGQYAGIIGIASSLIAFLALRFTPLEAYHFQMATLAAISAGAAFGFTKYTWHPSKIMWGFGAMSAGLVLSFLSINIQSKILASILIILLPFLDAIVTVLRRLLQRKNPLVGDKGHLHHLLLQRGWSVEKIAKFYWVTTFLFGLIGLISPEKYHLQVGSIVAGIVAFIIVLMNLRSIRLQSLLPPSEK